MFSKKPEISQKKKGSIGKVVAGLVIGGAVGSVLWMAFRKKHDEEDPADTRKRLREEARKALGKK